MLRGPHPRIFLPPTLLERALGARITGPLVHDAHVGAPCLHHGVDELWTADRDFGRFPALKVRSPLIV